MSVVFPDEDNTVNGDLRYDGDVVSNGYLYVETGNIIISGNLKSSRCIWSKGIEVGGNISVSVGDLSAEWIVAQQIKTSKGYVFAEKSIKAKTIIADVVCAPEIEGEVRGVILTPDQFKRYVDDGGIASKHVAKYYRDD